MWSQYCYHHSSLLRAYKITLVWSGPSHSFRELWPYFKLCSWCVHIVYLDSMYKYVYAHTYICVYIYTPMYRFVHTYVAVHPAQLFRLRHRLAIVHKLFPKYFVLLSTSHILSSMSTCRIAGPPSTTIRMDIEFRTLALYHEPRSSSESWRYGRTNVWRLGRIIYWRLSKSKSMIWQSSRMVSRLL